MSFRVLLRPPIYFGVLPAGLQKDDSSSTAGHENESDKGKEVTKRKDSAKNSKGKGKGVTKMSKDANKGKVVKN